MFKKNKEKNTYNYFDEFIKTSEYILESAKTLKETIKEYNKEVLEKNILSVHKLENEADNSLHTMRNYLIKDFLPPIDREDIIFIGHNLDDIEDEIDEVLINLNILNIESLREEIFEFVDLLLECAEKVKETLNVFKNFNKNINLIKEKVVEINKLEDRGDRIFEQAMKRLYQEEINSIEIIKWTTMFNCLENTIDSCENIANSIEDVIMKNS
ncbi:MAG: DUF47 family protein [Clostridiales bacterium]|nr:DUF47 family protein [Clostridiales bacterium]